MMTTNLFVIANVKQLRTGGSFRILLPFFWTSLGVGVLNSAIFNSFHNRVEFVGMLIVISQSLVKSMQNVKFSLLCQNAGAMLNTTSQLLTVGRTGPKAVGSEYGPDPDMWKCTFALPYIYFTPKGSHSLPFLQKCRFLNCTVWISVPVVPWWTTKLSVRTKKKNCHVLLNCGTPHLPI